MTSQTKSQLPQVWEKQATIRTGQLALLYVGVGDVCVYTAHCKTGWGNMSVVGCVIWDTGASEIMMKPECQRRLSRYKQGLA